MIRHRSKSLLLFNGNKGLVITSLILQLILFTLPINCQQEEGDSSLSRGGAYESRDRSAHVDRNEPRFNSNLQSSRRSGSLDQTVRSAIVSAHLAKNVPERSELPEKRELLLKSERTSSAEVVESSREEEYYSDEDRDLTNSYHSRNQHVSTSTTTTTTPSSLYSGEVFTRQSSRSTVKKSRTTRPPNWSSSTTTETYFSPSSPPRSHTDQGSSSSSFESRPGSTNTNLDTNSYPHKSTKQVNSFLSVSTKCSDNITLSSLTTPIVSPGWSEGQNYPPNVECIWIVTTMSSHFTHREPAIRIKIKHLEIEQDGADCPYDYLEIRGHKKLCGFMQNREILVNSSTLVIVFHTDSNNEDRGFELELSSHVEDCTPEVQAENSGEITSPGYPKHYPDQADCWTLINANKLANTGSRSGVAGVGQMNSENFTISVSFDFIDLEPDDQCNYDFVEFFEVDMHTKKPTKSLGRFCDEKSINKINSMSFMPGSRTSYQPGGTREPSSSSSSINGNTKPRATINAKGPYLWVHFKSDQLLNLRGFKAAYKVETDLARSSMSNCDWASDETSLTLVSPQYPKPYPPNKDCSLLLKAPRTDQKIVLVFESFQMEIDNNCTFDRLEIYDPYAGQSETSSSSSSSLRNDMTMVPTKVFCGHKSSKFKYLSGGPTLRLRFVSDSLHEHQGFLARYKFIQGGNRPDQPDQPERPVQSFTEVPKNASIISGSSHLLTCLPVDFEKHLLEAESGSNSNLHISWFKSNLLINDGISENGTKLLIREFSQSDAGRYICKYGQATTEAFLTVKNTYSDCRVIFRKRPVDTVLSEGDFAILECNAFSTTSTGQTSNNLTITWTKNGKKILSGSRIEILKNGYMVFNGVTKDDSGHYFCVARSLEDPGCTSQAGVRLDVSVRANVEDICGKPNLALPSKKKPSIDQTGKIVGGVNAEKGAHPWQVMFYDIVNRMPFCGGALLNERWIATAAHCFSQNKYSSPAPPIDNILVRLGKFDSLESEDSENNTKIQDVIRHPDYNPASFDNDLALIKIKDHIRFTDYIKPICLGSGRTSIEDLFFTDNHRTLKMGHVTGWGRLKEHGALPRFLQEIRMPIVQQDLCRKATSFGVTDNMFCAGYAQEIVGDACKGDSGGPFVGFSSNRWYLLGIVSWGEGCGRTGKYGYYTKVSNYIEWIRGLIKH